MQAHLYFLGQEKINTVLFYNNLHILASCLLEALLLFQSHWKPAKWTPHAMEAGANSENVSKTFKDLYVLEEEFLKVEVASSKCPRLLPEV
jgi:hypothetical protein